MNPEIRFQVTSTGAVDKLAEWCREDGLAMRRCTLVEDSNQYAIQVIDHMGIVLATVVAAPWCARHLKDTALFFGVK
jgi:hypothetical protein